MEVRKFNLFLKVDCNVGQIHLLSTWLCGDGAYDEEKLAQHQVHRSDTNNSELNLSCDYSSSILSPSNSLDGSSANSSLLSIHQQNRDAASNHEYVRPPQQNFDESYFPDISKNGNINGLAISNHCSMSNTTINGCNSALALDNNKKCSFSKCKGSPATVNSFTVNKLSNEIHSGTLRRQLPHISPGGCRLHLGCPPNCQDPLMILPVHASQHILQFLDPQSLARCIQVRKAFIILTATLKIAFFCLSLNIGF